MSLLRRFPSASGGSPFGDPPPPAPPRRGPVRELWHHQAMTPVHVVAMTRDNRFIIAGTRGGDVLFFDIAGRLLWNGRVEGSVYSIALAEDAHRFVVGTIDQAAVRRDAPTVPGHNATIWHFNGRLLHTLETEGEARGVAITPDGSHIAVGSQDEHLYVFDSVGAPVFKRKLAGAVYDVALSHDGDHVFAAADEHVVYAFDRAGSERWRFATEARPWAGIRVAHDAGVVLVGANDNRVYCLDFAGQEHWRFDTGGHVNALAITPDGRLCAAGGKARKVFVFNERGNVLWEYNTDDDVYGLALSTNGRYVTIGANDRRIRTVDLERRRSIWTHESSGRVHAVAITPSGRFFTAGTDGRSISVFNNTLITDDMQELTVPDSPILTRMVLRMVRDDYTAAPHMGLVRWFTEFERALRNNQFDVCRALLDLLTNENGLELHAEERQYTRSLEGAYWLFRGIAYHRNAQYDEARACYEQSKAIQHALNNQDGVGQVIAALSLLPGETGASAPGTETEMVTVTVGVESEGTPAEEAVATDDDDPLESNLDWLDAPSDDANDQDAHDRASTTPTDADQLLDEISRRPRVLGTSEKILEQRLLAAAPVEQFQIVVLAKDAGFITPLLRALTVEERVVRAAASAALALLDPGPNPAALAQMLRSGESFVRWQALRILHQRATNMDAADFKDTKTQVWDAILEDANDHSGNPLARREAAQVIRVAGSQADTPWLLDYLDDKDADVQVAVIEALGAVGNRNALEPLKKFEQSDRAFMGRSVGSAVADAIREIEQRHPLPLVGRVVFCQEDPREADKVRQRSVFMHDTAAVYAIITVEHVRPDISVGVKWRHNGTDLHTETQTLSADEDISRQPVTLVQETAIALPSRPPTSRSRFGRGERPGQRLPARDSRPFGSGQRSLLDRREDNAPSSRPRFPARRPGEQRPDSRPAFRRERDAPPRPGARSGERPGLGGRQRVPPPPSRQRPGLRREEDRPGNRPSPFGRRSSRFSEHQRTTPPAPNENVDPRSERDVPARTGSPFGDRARASRPRPSSFRDRAADRSGDVPRGRRPLPPADDRPSRFRRPEPPARDRGVADRPARPGAASRRPAPPRSWRQQTQEDAANASRFGRRSARGAPRPGSEQRVSRPATRRQRTPEPLPDHARQLVITLPRPAEGWNTALYELEISLDDDVKHRAQFKIVDTVQIVGVEPGLMPALGEEQFGHSHLFLTTSRYVDCQVHLKDAPVEVALTGRIVRVDSDAEVASASAQTEKEGNHTLTLTWENITWRPGMYRLEVTAAQGNTLSTEIEMIAHYVVQGVTLCHQVDHTNGPIGTDWPFYPADTVYCVVALGTPPPGVQLEVTWHAKDNTLPNNDPQRYATAAAHDHYASFKLPLREGQALEPGHYSVVVQGPNVSRVERSFEVLPPPVRQAWAERARKLWARAEPEFKKHSIGQMLVSAGSVLLLAIVLLLLNYSIDYAAGAPHIDADPILHTARSISHVNLLWVLGWLVLSGSYGVLQVRFKHDRGNAFEDSVFVLLNMLLTFASTLLIWFQLSTLVFGPGYLWPGAVWRLLDALRGLNPVLAWSGMLVALALVEIARQDDNDSAFWIAPLYAASGLAFIAVMGYVGALVLGVPLGLLGTVVGSPLHVVGLDNDLGHGLLALGGSVGFIVGPLAALAIYYREDLLSFWDDWTRARHNHIGEQYSLLMFLAEEDVIPIPLDQWTLLAQRAWRGAVLIVLLTLGAVLLFNPAVLPVLAWVYDAVDNPAFKTLLRDARLQPALALALLFAWPLLVHWAYRVAMALDLPPDYAGLTHRFSRALIAGAVLTPLIVLIASRTATHSGQPVAINVYWTNCVAGITLGVLLLIALAALLRRLPDDVRSTLMPDLALNDSDDSANIIIVLLCVAVAILLPVWMWTVLLVVALVSVAATTYLAERIT